MTIPDVKRKLAEYRKLDLQSECKVFRKVLLRELENRSFDHETRKEDVDMNKVCAYMMKNHSISAPILTSLYHVAVTAGYASARVECLFSALSRVLMLLNEDGKRLRGSVISLSCILNEIRCYR